MDNLPAGRLVVGQFEFAEQKVFCHAEERSISMQCGLR